MLATVEPDVTTLESTEAATFEVSVTWQDDRTKNGLWTFDPPGPIEVKSPTAQILYTLSKSSTPGVKFRVSPVLWIEPAAPDNFAVQLTDESRLQVSIVDANFTQGTEPEPFSFRFLAIYNDRTRISPDPTIINRDPS